MLGLSSYCPSPQLIKKSKWHVQDWTNVFKLIIWRYNHYTNRPWEVSNLCTLHTTHVAVYYKAHSHVINNVAVDNAASSSRTHKQLQTNNNNGHHIHHIHHTGTQHHCCEQLLTGWERVLLHNEGTATLPWRGKQWKKAQGTSFDIPWAVGKFFFLLISLFYC